jgi:ATP-dependent DNA helicase RecG
MGDFFGARQHGLPEFRFFDGERDEDMLSEAREQASALIDNDPELESEANEPLRRVLEARFREREQLFEVG